MNDIAALLVDPPKAKEDPLGFVHGEIDYNYRRTNIQAAMDCAQLEKFNADIAGKRRIAVTYMEALKDVPGLTPMREAPWASSVYWMYTVLVDESWYGMDSRALLRWLEAHQIQARPLWQPVHLSVAHRGSQPQIVQWRSDQIGWRSICRVQSGSHPLNSGRLSVHCALVPKRLGDRFH